MENLLTQYNQGLAGNQTKNQGLAICLFSFWNQRVGGSNPSVGSNFEKLSELSDYHHYLFFLLFRPENLTFNPRLLSFITT
jgi:hypothetical protein